ncbi:MAG: beta-N-acetylhexosaminidase [Thermodesulfobacteriota bacterium]
MKSWTVSNKILAGQRLMVGFNGTAVDEDLKYLINRLCVGGIILFSRNIQNPEQLGRLCRDAQSFALACGLPPLFIAVDQEGGEVARLKPPFTVFPGNSAMRNAADAVHFAQVTASELKGVGFNMNMAPVLDIAPSRIASIMAKRSFGSDPDRVSELGSLIIDEFHKNGIMAVAKHFPGIGRATEDPHQEISTLDFSLNELEQADLEPFKAAVSRNVAGIMLSHLLYQQLDPVWPASLSRRIAFDLLQTRMNYGGVVLTDDLDMGAIERHYEIHELVRQLIEARVDIALVCHRSEKIERVVEEFLKSFSDSPEALSKGVLSLQKIFALKKAFLGNGSGPAVS